MCLPEIINQSIKTKILLLSYPWQWNHVFGISIVTTESISAVTCSFLVKCHRHVLYENRYSQLEMNTVGQRTSKWVINNESNVKPTKVFITIYWIVNRYGISAMWFWLYRNCLNFYEKKVMYTNVDMMPPLRTWIRVIFDQLMTHMVFLPSLEKKTF